MKKRAVISLIMAMVLAIGLTAGSYAWFTASVTSSNNTINIGELKFDKAELGALIDTAAAGVKRPGDPILGTAKDIKNAGDFAMKKLTSEVGWTVSRTGSPTQITEKTTNPEDIAWADMFMVKPTITYNGNTYTTTDYIKISGLNVALDNLLGSIETLDVERSFTIQLAAKLHLDADNTYQGSSLSATVTILAEQEK